MSLWSRIKGAFASEEVGFDDPTHPRFYDGWGFGSHATTSGERVGAEAAMRISAYLACLRNIAEDIAKLPVHVYKRLDPRGREKQSNEHHVARVMSVEPNPDMAPMTMREMLTHWCVGWGNGYAEILRDGSRHVVELYPIHPSRVEVARTADGRIAYIVRAGNGGLDDTVTIAQRNMFHLRGLGNDIVGYSIMRFAAESLGLTLAAQTFGAAFFGNSATLGGVLEHPNKLGDKAYGNLKASLTQTHAGPYNAHKPMILEEGMKWNRIGIPPEEAQFLQIREFQIEEIARWFRVPLQKLYHHKRAQGWSTLETLNTDYVVDTLMSWATRWEQEIHRKLLLISERPDFYAKHIFLGLLRGDSTARASYYRERFNIGTLSQNDIRELEDEPPIANGDAYFVPMNLTELGADVGDGTDNEGGPPEPFRPEPDDGSESEGEDEARAGRIEVAKRAQSRTIADAVERALQREQRAAQRAAQRVADAEEFDAWAEKFYEGHEDAMVGMLVPSLLALTDTVAAERGLDGAPYLEAAQSVARQYAEAHATASRDDLGQAYSANDVEGRTASWRCRPTRAASALADRVVHGMTAKDETCNT